MKNENQEVISIINNLRTASESLTNIVAELDDDN